MEKEELLKNIAPCSLMCYTCSAYEKGVICQAARQLQVSLEGIQVCYEKNRPDQVEPFSIFESKLKEYAAGICGGCRDKKHCGCSIEGCFIFECTKANGVDFCGECNMFPCKRVTGLFEEVVYRQWLKGNQEIKEMGVQKFWEKNCKKPHYKAYIEQDK